MSDLLSGFTQANTSGLDGTQLASLNGRSLSYLVAFRGAGLNVIPRHHPAKLCGSSWPPATSARNCAVPAAWPVGSPNT